VAGGWRTLHNKNLHNLYALQNIIKVIKTKRMRLVGHVSCIGQIQNKILVVKAQGKKPLRRPSCVWEDDTRTYLREIIGWEIAGTSGGSCEHSNEPLDFIKNREFID
jgi:hypothetical protein